MLTVFTTKMCGQCKQVKKLLEHYEMPYNSVDVEENPMYQQMILEKTGSLTVPVVTNGKEYVIGYNPSKIRSLV